MCSGVLVCSGISMNRVGYTLMKEVGKVNTDEFKVGKEVQEENVRDLLTRLQPEDVIIFTDGSAFGNSGAGGLVE